jgi:hypothetical protein
VCYGPEGRCRARWSRCAARSRTDGDLATAEVTGDAISVLLGGRARQIITVPAVQARDPRTGQSVKIPLKARELKRLPPHELHALANAIMAVRQPTDPGYASAAAIAASMREMAANPFPV